MKVFLIAGLLLVAAQTNAERCRELGGEYWPKIPACAFPKPVTQAVFEARRAPCERLGGKLVGHPNFSRCDFPKGSE